jgi:hypothetical protein
MYSDGEDTETLDNAGRIAPLHSAYATLEDLDPDQEACMARQDKELHRARIVETVLPEQVFHVPIDYADGTKMHKVVKPECTRYTVRCLGCDRVYPVDTILLESALTILQEWDCPNKEDK